MTDVARLCPPEHRHGQVTTCYKQHGCRCLPCRALNARRESERARLKAYGRWDDGLVEAAPVREHLRWLAACGVGYKRVAVLAGVSRTGVRVVLYGRQQPGPRYGEVPARCDRAKAAAILAVRPRLASFADGARIPARGVHRRVQALVALGWSVTRIARELEMFPSNLFALLEQAHVTAVKHRAIATAYERLSAAPPAQERPGDRASVTRARRYAAARGWVPPLAWDDIDADPVPAPVSEENVVDELAIDHALAGHAVALSPAERTAAVRLADQHAVVLDRVLATRLHVSTRTVQRIRATAGPLPARSSR